MKRDGLFLWRGNISNMDILGIPTLVISIGAIIGGVIVGIFYLIGLFGKIRRSNNEDANEANEFVIKSLKEKIEILQQQMLDATNNLIATNKRLDELQHENRLLREILQGKDSITQQYYQAGYESMTTIKDLVEITKSNHDILVEIRNSQPSITTTTIR